jgi:multicomponent Na+:H+ antiporter subunit B
LEYNAYGFPDASKYSIELVELAIGLIVAGVVTGLFFSIDSGPKEDEP